jgi:two-component system, NarL family, nitrate/nitrite response regulator NarL
MHNKVLIVEDHPLYRGALAALLRALFGADGVLEAGSAEEGMRAVEGARDVRLILLDSGLPGLHGSEAVKAFRRKLPCALIIAISASEERREAAAVLQAGALAFLSKAVSTERIVDIVKQALDGELREPQWITANGSATITDNASWPLTARQREILILLSRGLSNKEIGLRLNLAEITVKLHVSAIFKALNVSNRTQAALAVHRLGV